MCKACSPTFDALQSDAFAEKITTHYNFTVNTAGSSGIALQGYDPVSCFTAASPTHGNPELQATYQGATYLFSSEEHQRQFEANPESYVPQFGGYCAYGVSLNVLFPVDISTAQIRDGKLYLNFSSEILEVFNTDVETHIAKALELWPSFAEKQ